MKPLSEFHLQFDDDVSTLSVQQDEDRNVVQSDWSSRSSYMLRMSHQWPTEQLLHAFCYAMHLAVLRHGVLNMQYMRHAVHLLT